MRLCLYILLWLSGQPWPLKMSWLSALLFSEEIVQSSSHFHEHLEQLSTDVFLDLSISILRAANFK